MSSFLAGMCTYFLLALLAIWLGESHGYLHNTHEYIFGERLNQLYLLATSITFAIAQIPLHLYARSRLILSQEGLAQLNKYKCMGNFCKSVS